MSETPNRVQ